MASNLQFQTESMKSSTATAPLSGILFPLCPLQTCQLGGTCHRRWTGGSSAGSSAAASVNVAMTEAIYVFGSWTMLKRSMNVNVTL